MRQNRTFLQVAALHKYTVRLLAITRLLYSR